ncbi:MAG: pyruvate kinase, partial [Pseudomonadota bacterium]
MRHQRSAKILATLGPSSSSPDEIKALFDAGADAFRFNFSHGTHEDHQARYEIVRRIEADAGRPISVVVDMQGPKLRVGTFENDKIELVAGASFRLDLEDKPGTTERVTLPHVEIFRAIDKGTEL